MDLITQAIVGAATAQIGVKPAQKQLHLKKATIIGAAAGLLPDADVLIRSESNPMLAFEMHRHFSHSLFFVPFGALIAALLLYFFYRKSLNFKQIYWYSFLGYSTHGILDSFTTYGTRLFWPISDERVSYNLVSIIDPLFSLPLLAFVILACVYKSTKIAKYGAVFCVLFFSFYFIQSQKVGKIVEQIASQNNHKIERATLLPTMANNILWKATYLYDGVFYTNAIRLNWLGDSKIYKGESAKAVNYSELFSKIPESSIMAKDIEKFKHFSSDFLAVDNNNPNLLVDARYSIDPTSTAPMWGIEINPENPNTHVKIFRNMGKRFENSNFEKFKKMLKAEEI